MNCQHCHRDFKPTNPVHRLAIGDSTDRATVERLLAGSKPFLMVVDPPYGTNYNPEWRREAGVNKNESKMGKVTNDDNADWTAAWELFPGNVAYIWHAGQHADIVKHSIEAAGFLVRAQIIWAKDRFALSRGDYHYQHEPCWYAVREHAVSKRSPDRTQSTLWPINARDDGGHGHGTQKPVECMARPIRNHGDSSDAVYDAFVGSGTTMVAAEQLGRSSFCIEIEPRYAAVVLERMLATCGVTGRLVESAVLTEERKAPELV